MLSEGHRLYPEIPWQLLEDLAEFHLQNGTDNGELFDKVLETANSEYQRLLKLESRSKASMVLDVIIDFLLLLQDRWALDQKLYSFVAKMICSVDKDSVVLYRRELFVKAIFDTNILNLGLQEPMISGGWLVGTSLDTEAILRAYWRETNAIVSQETCFKSQRSRVGHR